MKLTKKKIVRALEDAATTKAMHMSDVLALQWVARNPECVAALLLTLNATLAAMPPPMPDPAAESCP